MMSVLVLDRIGAAGKAYFLMDREEDVKDWFLNNRIASNSLKYNAHE